MASPKKVHINNNYYTSLSDDYNDRPEFHRHHEQSLWTIYQVMKAGNNHAVVYNNEGQEEIRVSNEVEFRSWVARTYPGFEYQLDKAIYTAYPHPGDKS
jgi:hypothetical protein